ncbi:phosphopantetheine-binding protein [Rhizobium rhizogenes]|jgi:acyl carrier protein|uniref:phosphopantetheine-binding protein n=1 Tax=Rhizobium rhizogenes TaxID=359 RepID=UPI0015732143|nr:phosphopantetheine-binding protein [Rhizobium rhizogenes]NTF85450.1 hypothetical protein [Rhizobium rhizogenes]
MKEKSKLERLNIETRVSAILQELFDRDTIEYDDNFFDMGGTSLAALKLILEVESSFGIDSLTPEQLYRAPTLNGIVEAIEINVR